MSAEKWSTHYMIWLGVTANGKFVFTIDPNVAKEDVAQMIKSFKAVLEILRNIDT